MTPIRTVPEDRRRHYRGKVCLSTRWDSAGWHFGLVRRDTLIPIHRCPVHAPGINQAIALFSTALPPAREFPLAYYAHSGSQVTLVVKSPGIPDPVWLDAALASRLAAIGIDGLWLHLHPCAGKKVFAKNVWRLLWGRPKSRDPEGFVHGPRSFRQLIPELHQAAMDQADAFLRPGPFACVADLYCGIGAGLARWRKQCGDVIGVELDGEAVSNARINAPDVLVLRGTCRERLPQLREWADTRPAGRSRLLYVNPPRTGLEPETLRWIADEYKPRRMAYLSCSAGTLHRDLLGLEAAGYRVEQVIPFDFFPGTSHVETLVLLAAKD